MLVTLLGIVILVILEQALKAQIPMLVTPFFIITEVMAERYEYHGTFIELL